MNSRRLICWTDIQTPQRGGLRLQCSLACPTPIRGRLRSPDVRVGSKADIAAELLNVRFTPESGNHRASSVYALCAKVLALVQCVTCARAPRSPPSHRP